VTRLSPRITLFLVTTVVAVVLLFSYRTSRGPGASAATVGDATVGIVTTPDSGSSAPTGTDTSSSTSDSTVVNGTVVSTRWGPVQVQVTISAGRITDVTALQYPQGNGRDVQINNRALPILHDRVLAAQSADIDVVTGATVTSEGYIASLQAALDMAHFE
jgi:uncharacterized protein with FMN-binding domain